MSWLEIVTLQRAVLCTAILAYATIVVLAVALCKAAAKPMPPPPHLGLSGSARLARSTHIPTLPPKADPTSSSSFASTTLYSPTHPAQPRPGNGHRSATDT